MNFKEFLNESVYDLTVQGADAKFAGKALRELGIQLISGGYREGSNLYHFHFRTQFDNNQIEGALKENNINIPSITLIRKEKETRKDR